VIAPILFIGIFIIKTLTEIVNVIGSTLSKTALLFTERIIAFDDIVLGAAKTFVEALTVGAQAIVSRSKLLVETIFLKDRRPPEGYALQFDGVNDYVEIPASQTFNLADEITIMGWIKRANSLSSDATIWRKGPGDHFLCIRTDKTPDFDLWIDGDWRYCRSPNPIDTNWHFIAGTYSSLTDKTLKLYVDAVLVRSLQLTGLSTYQD